MRSVVVELRLLWSNQALKLALWLIPKNRPEKLLLANALNAYILGAMQTPEMKAFLNRNPKTAAFVREAGLG